jgi:hypothetical protein
MEQELVASDAAESDQFGWAVSLAGERALVGAYASASGRGAAYVFARSGSSWTEERKLVASDGAPDDRFGYAVALSDDHALVGAPTNDAARGAAYVFARDGSSWTDDGKLVASDGAPDDRFGISASLTADRALLGAYWNDAFRGAAYAFVRGASSWIEEQKLVASDAAEGHRFGNSISLGEDRMAIGAYAIDSGRGAAYVFARSGGTWTAEQTLFASDGASNDLFGWSVSLSADRVLVGAPYDDNLRGAGYVFSLGLPSGDACADRDDCASGYCVDERCCNVDCAGGCGACSIEAGAEEDGTCSIFPAGSEGSPPCRALACNGESPECAPCESDDDCTKASFCAADQRCQPRKAQGEACDVRAEQDCFVDGCQSCESGLCVDGVCCDEACDGSCEACTIELKGNGDDGDCGTIETGPDPDEGCSDDGSALGEHCASDGECSSGHCTDGVCCDADCHDTCGGCTAALKGGGDDGTCGYVAAGLNPPASSAEPTRDCAEDAACRGSTSCNGAGRCACIPECNVEADCAPGERCSEDGECVSVSKTGDPDDDSGCGCRTLGSSRSARSPWLVMTVALLLVARRFRDNCSARSRRVSFWRATNFSR